MAQALYRKYRSKSLDEIVGQEHITDTLKRALTSGRISHAYLFTGPRGVGKTSIARILAHEINNLPYTDDQTHIDIIEIDAASNRRIDEIRELRDKVYIAPSSAKYKVYIIDEVHMLTREAFNALLKTLEEPPAHVVFILATTDAHKLPETIISRTQRFTFRPVEQAKVIEHLRTIAKEEKIAVDDEALALLATHGEGSFRDSISLLDQASNQADKVTGATIRELLGIPSETAIMTLLQAIIANDASALLKTLNDLYNQGYQAGAIAKNLGGTIRSELTATQPKLDFAKALELLGKLIEVGASQDPERLLEIVLLGALSPTSTQPAAPSPPSKPAEAPKPVAQPTPAKVATSQKKVNVPKPTPVEAPDISPEPSSSIALDEKVWPELLTALKQRYNTLYGIVRMARPDFSEPGKLNLTFAFAFHQKRINDAKNRKIVADILHQLTGEVVQVACHLDKTLATSKPAAKSEKTPQADINSISNIFGGGELLES